MNSTVKRVLTTAIAPPALFALILFLPHASYAAFSVLAILVTIGGAHELKALMKAAQGSVTRMPTVVSALLPLAQWIQHVYLPHLEVTFYTFVILCLVVCTLELTCGKKDSYNGSITRISGGVFILFYPGLLITFIQRVTVLHSPDLLLILFFLIIFGNDVFAYVFGMWLGKNNRGWADVSPNKSIAGLVGGILSAMILSTVLVLTIPALSALLTITQTLIISALTAIVANIGDLIESAFKRSAKMKDSGTLIPGRGGLLDSIDSMLIASPIFFLLLVAFGVQ